MRKIAETRLSRYARMAFSDVYTATVRGIGPIHLRKNTMDLWVLR